MNPWIAAGAIVTAGVLAPRVVARVLRRDPETPVESFGFRVHEPASRDRVAGIVRAFFTGYNGALAGTPPEALRARCESLPAVLHPFAFEGAGMGRGGRGVADLRVRTAGFAAWAQALHPGWHTMYYVGLGIWCGMLGRRALARTVRAVPEPEMQGLVHDGFGFHAGFFHRVRDAQAHRRLAAVPEAERLHAWRGYGRSLWFVFRDDPAGLVAAVDALPEAGRDAAACGVGLAVVFTLADDLGAALSRLSAFPAAWQRELERGLRLALHVRHLGQAPALAGWIAAAPEAARLRADLDHAVGAYAATRSRPTYLHDFTRAC